MVPPEPRLEFHEVLDSFLEMLDALLELAEVITPHVASLDRPRRVSFELKPPPDKAEAFYQAIRELSQAQRTEQTDEEFALSVDVTVEDDVAREEPTSESAPTGPVGLLSRAFIDAFGDDPENLRAIARTLDRAIAPRPKHGQILNGALLTIGVGALETLVATVATQHYVRKPEALESQGNEFSLADLLAFEDLSDARSYAIGRRVESLMRGSIEDWMRWFQERLGDEVEHLAQRNQALFEILQRRHVVVHNGGRVSRLYKVKTGSREPIGAELPVDGDYLRDAIDEIEIFGARLGLLAWVKWADPPEGDVAEYVNGRVFALLEAERWAVAELLASTGARLRCRDETRLSLQVNEWQAAKRRRGLESIRDKVNRWDTTALEPMFPIAKAALLDDFETLAALVPGAVAKEDLALAALDDWPLFREARESERWKDIRPQDTSGAEPNADQGIDGNTLRDDADWDRT